MLIQKQKMPLRQAGILGTCKVKQVLKQTSELIFLHSLLNMEVVALKGPVLALDLYGDLGARQSKDIDLVIKPEDIFKADQILQQQGYERAFMSPKQLRSHLYWSKDFVYWHPQKQICLELHWRLFQDWECFSVFEVALQETEISGVKIKHLSPEYNLLYLCTHGCESAWSNPKWALDIQKLLAKYELDWKFIWREAERWDLERALREGIEGRVGREQTYIWRLSDWMHKLMLRKKLKNKAKVLLSLFVPRLQDFQALALPDNLFFLYYLLRPILAIHRNVLRLIARRAAATTFAVRRATAFATVTESFLKTD